MQVNELLKRASTGLEKLNVDSKYKQRALLSIEKWLTNNEFKSYVPQIVHLIESKDWDFLLDSFYQTIPFGTGGRRGEVGIGPNRINPWTIMSSAQGHSQYLLKKHGDGAKERGVVLAYDVRQFFTNDHYNDNLPNPVRNVSSKSLAEDAAKVYTANGLKVYMFESFRTTPELSFAIRYLNAVGGAMFSASHNPPTHNGKKVYDEYGGQLIPPFDEELVKEVTNNVKEIRVAKPPSSLCKKIGEEIDQKYIQACKKLTLSNERDTKILYAPLSGTGTTSVLVVLKELGFDVLLDPKTSDPDPRFSNITFNIPNPEVVQSFKTALEYADNVRADIILNSDPDADRIGVMALHKGRWHFLSGNEIGAILTEYSIQKRKSLLKGKGVVIKTQVTTSLISKIAKVNGMDTIDDLLVGFKYIADVLNKLERDGKMDNFLIACEESHGYLAGNYSRDKDAVVPAIWLSELAAELKKEGGTLVDYLQKIYSRYGYFRNYLTEIRLPGAEGMSKIKNLQSSLKTNPPHRVGRFKLSKVENWMDRKPIVSETDKAGKAGVVFYYQPVAGTLSVKVTVRPSGTEPKIKMYFEIGGNPFDISDFEKVQSEVEDIRCELEEAFMTECYRRIGVEFPKRGFLLFWQLPLQDKLKYFEVESEIEKLKGEQELDKRKKKVLKLLSFLGTNPIQKVDNAFKAKYGSGINEFLELAT